MSEQKPHIIVRLLKSAGWLVLTLAVLAFGFRYSLKTDAVHKLAKNKAVSFGNDYLNGKLGIGEIKGDLWKDFRVQDLYITNEKDTVVSLEELHLEYNIWDLLNQTFTASNLELSGLYANIRETEKGRFNLQDLVKTDTTIQDSTSSSFGINLQHIAIQHSELDVWMPSYLPDSTLKVNELNATAGFQLIDEISGSLHSLSFRLKEGRLPQPISLEMAASYDNKLITLNQLVLETGKTLIRANGQTNLADSTLNAEVNTQPFAIKDIESYLDMHAPIPDDQLQLSLKAGGRLDSLNLELTGEGTGFDELLMISNLSLNTSPSLNKFGFSVKNIDLGYFTQDSVNAQFGEIQGTVEGKMSQNPEQMDVTWGATIHEIVYEDYQLEMVYGSGTVKDGVAQATIEAKDGKDHIATYTNIYDLFSEKPDWDLRLNVDHIDLGWWLRDADINGRLSFVSEFKGKGFSLSEDPWTFSVSKPIRPVFNFPEGISMLTASREEVQKYRSYTRDTLIINDQKFANIDVNGTISRDQVTAKGFVQLIENKIELDALVQNYLEETPSYEYRITTKEFNASEIHAVEDLPTSINLKLTGNGSSFNPDDIELQTRLSVDSSFVNGAVLDSLNIKAGLNGNIFTIEQGRLASEAISGTFSGRRNITDVTDPKNDIALNMEVKNIQPLARTVGVEVLNAKGNISGNITNETEEQLKFSGNVDLADVRYDTLFSAQSISGKTTVMIGLQYGYDLSLDINEPAFNGLSLEDVRLQTTGIASPDSVLGSFNFEVISSDAGRISQTGSYHITPKSWQTEMMWSSFEFETPARTLTLQQPFHLSYKNASIQSDTLKLESKEGTYLDLAIPYADSTSQDIWVEGQDFDFGVIQEILFDERFVDGVLSGQLVVHNNSNELTGSGALSFTRLAYQGTNFDRLNLGFDLREERLKANLNVTMEGEEKMVGTLDVPFIPADPNTLSDEFFMEPVNGELIIHPVALSEFKDLLANFNITETEGVLSFNGNLSGTAGEPDMSGVFRLANPTLSGVKIDSAFADLRYHHRQKKITATANIDAKGQRAASINAAFPVSMDFRTFALTMPEPTDSLHVNVVTDQFNISVFNDFLDKEYTRNLRGILNAELTIDGPFNQVQPTGFMSLHSGHLSIPIAGISLNSINSELEFTENGLLLNSFSMKSGGAFTANGTIKLDGLTPSGMDINAKATRFQAANTDNYNFTIDLDSRLSGNPLRPKVSGRLAVKNGFIFLQDFGEKSVEAVTLEDEEVSSFSPYDSLAIDMQFVIERNFLVRNRRYLDMEIALTGELDAQKSTDEELELFGTLNAQRGYVRPLGKQFNLEEGTFTFSGPVAEPDIFIRTSYIPQTAQKQTGNPITLFYIIEGNAQDPDFRFESEPYMEQQDIICYTLFNKPCYALESWQQVVSGGGSSAPTDLLVDVLLNEVETLATQQLGIDVVQIDNSSSEGKTSIKTGWYLNRRTFFAVINEISGSTPETLFILEYLLNENLDLIITQGDDNRQGIDLRWQYDY
ncbi:translocation/assembly module TamB domain-containing protein [Gracilimonas tropica]|uniref:translocation/assembly module TamB domain-containing protein n=1 Tax=Gracilimonas tropica TaxID=454600 RepID=UPI00036C9025|nr:translocation/assembly module TamB domain-containing protein [Gracilimonas tropica]